MEEGLKYEFEHKEIIERFGRYPTRNKVLGRQNTAEEEKYLMNFFASKNKAVNGRPSV